MEEIKDIIKKHYQIVFDNEDLLLEAFTHSSYVNEHRQLNLKHNERIEFLGDAVLEVVVSEFLFHQYPEWNEGKLTRLRAQIVCEPSLAAFAKECSFDQYIRLGKGEERMNGRHRPALLCDLFEAFIGALFLDKGMEAAKKFIYQVVLPKIKEDAFSHAMDYKTLLQEELQKDGDIQIQYRTVLEEGPSHAKSFEIEVYANDKLLGTGKGTSKKSAEQNAAQMALKKIVKK
ncbi:ribonuclease III [Jeotgalibaca ciconiae]|uniref:Ribonuclease 3 n=1 Tax=Jeotgalibaca ciconiae TaxID=2496265 RepID=A0A3S9HD10_9LACT|nr:ribonuclease III [Jeotgalibaca ciconiae]AZP05217.1 ribonuclease III [Jeotgalibaca ciconiae]HJB23785.1 ribonuclease III [Candidatus Jeotgalibaca pullicola]